MMPPRVVHFWLDENMPPSLVVWLRSLPGVSSDHFRELGYTETDDQVIFEHARVARTVIVTKDSDFAVLALRHGSSPPQVVWVRTGNTNTLTLKRLFESRIESALQQLAEGSPLIALE